MSFPCRSASARRCREGTNFDVWTSAVIIVGYAIPSFILAILLIVLFAGGSYFSWFPLRGLTSDNFDQMNWFGKIGDYAWHLVLPLTALGIGGFATMTLLTKNSFLDEIRKQYVVTARAKGLTERRVLYGHVFRNAMLLVISGFPGAFLGPSLPARSSSKRSSRSMGWATSPTTQRCTATIRSSSPISISSRLSGLSWP